MLIILTVINNHNCFVHCNCCTYLL